jgi:predicted GIY-YIG superfamily endonuclease
MMMGAGTSKYLQKQLARKTQTLDLSGAKQLSSKFWVYLIKCTNPKNQKIAWYVGWTQRDPSTRLQEHLVGKGNAFLGSAAKCGCKLELAGKEWFSSHRKSTDREAALILQLRSRLLNVKLESMNVKTRISADGNTFNYRNAQTNFDCLMNN